MATLTFDEIMKRLGPSQTEDFGTFGMHSGGTFGLGDDYGIDWDGHEGGGGGNLGPDGPISNQQVDPGLGPNLPGAQSDFNMPFNQQQAQPSKESGGFFKNIFGSAPHEIFNMNTEQLEERFTQDEIDEFTKMFHEDRARKQKMGLAMVGASGKSEVPQQPDMSQMNSAASSQGLLGNLQQMNRPQQLKKQPMDPQINKYIQSLLGV